MPYSKRSNNRRVVFKRRRRVPRKYSNPSKQLVVGHGPTLLERIASGVGTAAKVASAVLPAIAAINTEMKYYDETSSVSAYTPGTNDSILLISHPIAEGTGDSERVGNSILAKNLSVRVALNFPTSAGPPIIAGLHCRVMLLCYKANVNQAGALTAAQIFEDSTNLYSPLNKDNSDQIVVLKDKFFSMNAPFQPSAAVTTAFQHMKIYKDLNWHIRWNDAGQATTNHIYLVFRSSATGLGTALNATYYSRLNYTDN